MKTDGSIMRKMGDQIKKELPHGYGFCLLVFEFHKPGMSNYISNAQRPDMIKSLRETADRLENKQDFPTPENN